MKKSLFENVWIIRLVSLIFTLMLVSFVQAENNKQYQRVSSQQSTSVESSETISNVPVYLGDHDDDAFISGLPETVQVRLTGPKNILSQITVESFQVKTEGLTGVSTGRRTIRLVVENLPDGVSYQITPSQVVATISKKKTVTMPVGYELEADVVAAGYRVDGVAINPESVTLTGRDDTIDKIQKVVVKVRTNEPKTESFEQEYKVQILDSEGNLLDVNADVATVKVNVTIGKATNEVPLEIVAQGEQVDKYQYAYEFVNNNTTNVEATPDILSAITTIPVVVDVTGVVTNTTLVGYINVPDGVVVSQQAVEIFVKVTPIEPESNQQTNESQSESETSENSNADE